MNGLDQFRSLKDTLFSPKNNVEPYPDLNKMSYAELKEKEVVAKQWLTDNPDNPLYPKAKNKYNWIVYYLSSQNPDGLPVKDMLTYLL